jgi:C-terminal processing protease CtpA/Prc
LIAIDGAEITDLKSTAHLTSSEQKPVTLTLRRDEKPLVVTVQREESATLLRKAGWKILPDGTWVRADSTDAEIKYLIGEMVFAESPAEIQDRSVAFPEQHYPVNKELYYPGFEVFLFDKGEHIIVGGMEDGPASRAGLRWGDRIVAINSVDPRGKSAAEIESMLSSIKLASISLTISRGEAPKTFTFALAQAATVLRENRWRVVNGELVPLWSPDKYLSCWE